MVDMMISTLSLPIAPGPLTGITLAVVGEKAMAWGPR